MLHFRHDIIASEDLPVVGEENLDGLNTILQNYEIRTRSHPQKKNK